MDHVRVGLHAHELVHHDAAVLAHAPEVVAAEVHQHHVLGALLLVGEQLSGALEVSLRGVGARPRAGDRPLLGAPAGDGDERLGRGAGDLEVLEVEEVHVRAGIDGAQPAVDRERLDRAVRAPALARNDLVRVAGADVLLGSARRRPRSPPGRDWTRTRPAPGVPPASAAPAPPAARARRRSSARPPRRSARVLVGHHVGQHRDLVAQVVERHEHVGHHQREIGHTGVVRSRRPDGRLRRAHEVVAEQAHRAAGERRQPLERRRAPATELLGHERVGVLRFALLAVDGEPAALHADHAARPEAEERPAPDPLPLLGRLEQERGRPAAQLEVGRHRRFAVGDEGVPQRDERVIAREPAHLLQRGHEPQLRGLSGDGHSAPRRLGRGSVRAPPAARRGGRARRPPLRPPARPTPRPRPG